MIGKVKLKKYIVKEIVVKVDVVIINCGGGKVGLVDCFGVEKGGYVKLECFYCKVIVFGFKFMQIYYDVCYFKIFFDEFKFINFYVIIVFDFFFKFKFGVCGSLKK